MVDFPASYVSLQEGMCKRSKQFNNWCTFPGAPTLWIQHSPAEFCDLGGENQGKQQELSNEKQGPLVVWDI